MSKYLIFIFGIITLLLSSIPLIFYRLKFGPELILDHEKWGQFGDFAGGILNPFIALFSFLALLATLWYQSTEIKENTNSRKVNELATSLQLLEHTILPKMEHIISRHYTLPSKNKYVYRMADSLALDLKLCSNLMIEISNLSKTSSVIDYYQHKYLDIVEILFKKDYLTKEIRNRFNTAEE